MEQVKIKGNKMSKMNPAFMMPKLIVILVSLFFTLPASGREQPPAMVKTVKAIEGTRAAHAQMTGTLYFEKTSRVSPEEAGRVTVVNFSEGDRVAKGDILVRMDSQILETELALQKARLAQADIRIEKTKLNLNRHTLLFQKDVATKSGYDDLRLTHEEMKQERIALSRQVDILKIRLSKYIVKAPFDGIVLTKETEAGEWVQPGSLLCKLGALDALYAQVPVAEHLAGFTRTNDRLNLTLNAFNKEISGVVEGIRPMADPKTKNISLKLRLNYNGPMAVNMSVTVVVPVAPKRRLILLPRDALVQPRGKDTVYAIKENKAMALPVKVLYSNGDQIGVSAQGLKAGMVVVTQGNERLKPGQTVMIQGAIK